MGMGTRPSGMDMGEVSYPWVWVRIKYYTHQLYMVWVYVIALHYPLPSLPMGMSD
jgi:hypothetical protein